MNASYVIAFERTNLAISEMLFALHNQSRMIFLVGCNKATAGVEGHRIAGIFVCQHKADYEIRNEYIRRVLPIDKYLFVSPINIYRKCKDFS